MELPKYFRLMATSESPFFEPIAEWAGAWYGVAKVEDEKEAQRLIDLKVTELTPEQYALEVKKKAAPPNNSPDFRPVFTAQEPVVQRAVHSPSDTRAWTIDGPIDVPPKAPAPTELFGLDTPSHAQLSSAVPIPARKRSTVSP